MTMEETTNKTNKKNSKTGIILLAGIAFIGILLAFIQCGESKKEISSATITSKRSAFWINLYKTDYIGIMEISGTIEEANATYNQAWLLNTVSDLKNDKKNKALIIEIDSPGGTVYHADALYLALKEYAQVKPLYAYFKTMAASGGYYIACAADQIYSNRNTLTGSIGVIGGMAFDLTQMLDDLGIKTTTIHSGKNKNMLNFNEPVTDEQKAIMQSISDEYYEQFTQIVADGRKMSLSEVKKLADGRIYTALQAKNAGLVDEIASLDQTIDALKTNNELPSDINIERLSYEKKKTMLESMLEIKSFIPSWNSEAELLLNLIESPVPFPAYYYAP